MPFQSEKQRRYLWANEPEIARDWTDTYGSRIRRDNGGIMDMASDGNLNHEFENYINNGNVTVPKSFQARSHSTPVNLAYITDKEAGILQALKPGTPHRGPMEIPNYDDYDPTGGGYGRATSGQQMSAMETGGGQTERHRADARSLGYTPQEVRDIRGGAQQAAAMGQRGSGFNFNPLSAIGGLFGKVGSGIGFLLGKGKDWAGKMRGGINPKTGRYYTQAEYEQNRRERIANKRIQNILGREAPIRDITQRNLANLYKQAGTTQGFMPDVGSTRTGRAIDKDYTMGDTLREYPISANRIQDIQRDWNNQAIKPPASEYEGMWENRGINQAIPAGWRGNPQFTRGLTEGQYAGTPIDKSSSMMGEYFGLEKTQQEKIAEAFGMDPSNIALAGMNKEQVDYLNRIKREGIGSSGYSTFTKSERYPDQMAGAFFEYADPTDVWTDIESLNPKSTNMFSSAVNPEKIVYGDKTTFAQPDEVTRYIQSLSPKDKTYSHGLRKNVSGVDYTKPTWAEGGRISKALGGRSRDI